MPSPPVLMQRVLVGVVAALLVAGVVTAIAQGAGSGSSGRVATAARPAPGTGPTTTTKPAPTLPPAPGSVAAVPSASAGAGSGRSTAPAPSSAPVTTSAPATVPPPPPPGPHALPVVSGAAGDPGQPTATTAGTYRYTVSFSGGNQGSSSGTMTEKVTTTATTGGTTRQTVEDTESSPPSQDSPPDQGDNTQDVKWSATGLDQLSTKLQAGNQTVTCTWSPPILELPSGLAVGRQWSLAGSCQVTLYGQPSTVRLNGTGTVTGQQTVRVGADAVPVWVISDAYTVTVHVQTLGATIILHHNATDRVSGRLGLIVEEDATDTFTFGGQTNTSQSHQELQGIHPS